MHEKETASILAAAAKTFESFVSKVVQQEHAIGHHPRLSYSHVFTF